jgi:hypothetical protein
MVLSLNWTNMMMVDDRRALIAADRGAVVASLIGGQGTRPARSAASAAKDSGKTMWFSL